MTFASTSFLFAFFPIVLFAYYGMPIRIRNIFLLITSIIFYTLAEPNYVLILMLTTILNYVSGIIIEKACISELRFKLIFLIFPIICNLSILIFFKDILLLFFGIDQTPITPVPPLVITTTKILIPIGISYYILQVISYLIDVYLNRIIAETNFINFALSVTMFPKVIAGPITKYGEMKPALDNRVVYLEQLSSGVNYFIFGLVKKVLISNNIALLWESIYSLDFETIPVGTAWLGALAFSLTLYFDMTGYTDMAIGIGKMIGFNLPNNFNYPYTARSITQFFECFHITLIHWFEEYISQPIKRSQLLAKYDKFKFFIATLTSWILIGVWHGITAGTVAKSGGVSFSANFIIFGIYFGVIICCERFFKDKIKFKIPRFLKHIYTIAIVTLGFVLLDPSDIIKTSQLIKTMLFMNGFNLADNQTLHLLLSNFVILIFCAICSCDIIMRINNKYDDIYPKYYPIVKYILTFTIFIISLSYLIK